MTGHRDPDFPPPGTIPVVVPGDVVLVRSTGLVVWAGAVTVRVSGINAATLNQKLTQLPTVKRTAILKEEATRVTARVFPKGANTNGALARSIAEAAQGWHIEELHTEEGRLDEVFRSITMPDTAAETGVK